MKKIFSFTLAFLAVSTMAFAAKSATVDCGEQVKMTATPVTGYHFVRWNDNNTDNPRFVEPTQDIAFKAFFAINQYDIIFNNWNDTLLQKQTLNHGDMVTYTGETPTKTGDAQYTYTFDGWSPNIVSPAVGTATYKATFTATVNKYKITFLNYDSTILQASEWEYGQTPAYTGETPIKPADAQYTYTFTGWDKTISSVTGEATYVAQFTNSTNSYTITVEGENGVTTGGGTYQYGTEVTITATPNTCYKFVKWSDGDTNATRQITVTGTTTYTAIFEKIQYTVTVESDNETQGSADVEKYIP